MLVLAAASVAFVGCVSSIIAVNTSLAARGITCALSSLLVRVAAALPASTAACTAPTSPQQ